jgi:hypothetical protein
MAAPRTSVYRATNSCALYRTGELVEIDSQCVAIDPAIDGDPVAAKGLIGICGPRLYSILLNWRTLALRVGSGKQRSRRLLAQFSYPLVTCTT